MLLGERRLSPSHNMWGGWILRGIVGRGGGLRSPSAFLLKIFSDDYVFRYTFTFHVIFLRHRFLNTAYFVVKSERQFEM